MFLLRVLLYALVFYLVINLGQRRQLCFRWKNMVFPLSLSLALNAVNFLLKITFMYALAVFLLLFLSSYLLLSWLGRRNM